MNDKKSDPRQVPLNDEKAIEALIRLGGQRDEIDPRQTERVRHHVYQAWLQKNQQQDRPSLITYLGSMVTHARPKSSKVFASAAALVLIVFGAQQFLQEKRKPVANVKALEGHAVYQGVNLQTTDSIATGTEVSTGTPAGLSLELVAGGVLKLDQYSRIYFMDRENVRLLSGAVYFDSKGSGSIHIHTPHGIARDIGTQFEARLSPGKLLVRVRDGRVRVDRGKNAVLVDSGQALQLADGAAEVSDIPPGQEPWVWADALDEDFTLDGHSMAEILAWIARRETWTLTYADDLARQRAGEDIIHGDLETQDSRELLRQLSLISDMRFELNANSLMVHYPQ